MQRRRGNKRNAGSKFWVWQCNSIDFRDSYKGSVVSPTETSPRGCTVFHQSVTILIFSCTLSTGANWVTFTKVYKIHLCVGFALKRRKWMWFNVLESITTTAICQEHDLWGISWMCCQVKNKSKKHHKNTGNVNNVAEFPLMSFFMDS